MPKKNLFFYVFMITVFLIGSAAGSPAKADLGQFGSSALFFDAQQCNAATDCEILQCYAVACDFGQCVYSPLLNGAQCPDKNFCNGMETCQDGVCLPGTPVVCAPNSVACTVEACSEATKKCGSTPDNSLCNDSISCTNDTCDARRGCIYVPNNSLCDDGISCTMGTCVANSGCTQDSSACISCSLLGVSWSTSSVQNGDPVAITVASAACTNGEIVDLQLWESDSANGSSLVAGIALPSITLSQGTGSIAWNAVWASDTGDPPGFSGNPGDPEYFVKAILHSNPLQIVFTQTILYVANNVLPDGNIPRYNFCPTPIGIRPCTAAVWKESPDCRWDTLQCNPNELNQTCIPAEKKCNSNFLQECKVAIPAQWENIKQCPNGCDEESLDCNVSECIEDWKCTDWSSCANNVESRLCPDAAQCGTAKNKPQETRACSNTAACGDGTCSSQENSINCPADCKITELPDVSTENLVLLTVSLIIFGAIAIVISQMLSSRQRL